MVLMAYIELRFFKHFQQEVNFLEIAVSFKLVFSYI